MKNKARDRSPRHHTSAAHCDSSPSRADGRIQILGERALRPFDGAQDKLRTSKVEEEAKRSTPT